MTTSIDTLSSMDEICNNITSMDIFDMDVSTTSRINILDNQTHDEQIENINKLTSMFLVSSTTLLKNFIINICMYSTISPILKIECAKCLCMKESNIDNFHLLNRILETNELPIPCYVLSTIFLTKQPEMSSNAVGHFKNIINNNFIECMYKYNMILSLDSVYNLDRNIYIFPLLLYFSQLKNIFITYKILCCQNLLQYYKDLLISNDYFINIQQLLYSFTIDEELDYNLRADATDVLLGLGDSNYKKLAHQIIINLGNRGHTIYDDQQNIHNSTIHESTEPILKTLYSLPLNKDSTFNNIKSTILSPINDQIKFLQQKLDTLNITFNRIELDRSLYGSINTSILNLLCHVHSYILNNTHQEELLKRLEEELIDASGKCSTGYGTRLINVLSGYDDFNLKISWEDNICSKVSGKLNNLIKSIDDEELKGNILLEMTLTGNSEILNRQNFMNFFRSHIGVIKEEIWNDVKDDVQLHDFELYFRKAVSKYEGIEFF